MRIDKCYQHITVPRSLETHLPASKVCFSNYVCRISTLELDDKGICGSELRLGPYKMFLAPIPETPNWSCWFTAEVSSITQRESALSSLATLCFKL